MTFCIEFGLVLAAAALAFAFPGLGSRGFEAAERALGRLAERPRLAVLMVGVTALAARAALLPILPVPEPAVHDEFSYLLAADTFAHGRLANPTHPLWIHFETFHVLWHPTYASMYPPAQGLILAFGQAVLGHPFWGVWLSLGVMCAALCWMLQGWLPPKWALLGGLLAVIRLATFSYWANTYWGGAAAATGGALVYGALPRLKQSPRIRHALLLGLGLAILANSRPYEGLVFSLPVAAALLVWMLGKNRPPFRQSFRRLILPAGLLLAMVAVLMGAYNRRVTGSPWRMPQLVNRAAYAVAPYFLGQSPRPVPVYHHAVMVNQYLNSELRSWNRSRSLGGVASIEGAKAFEIWFFYVHFAFTLPLLLAAAVLPHGSSWRDLRPDTRFLLAATGFGLVGYAMEVFVNPHYLAAGTCLAFALILAAMRSVRPWRWRGKPVGLAITRAVPLVCAAMLLVCAATAPSLRMHAKRPYAWYCPGESMAMLDRARTLALLQHEPGSHLVIVRYSALHDVDREWVYNRADIDGAKVVWAHDMDKEQNQELISYFKDRRVWLVEPDVTPPRLSAYPTP